MDFEKNKGGATPINEKARQEALKRVMEQIHPEYINELTILLKDAKEPSPGLVIEAEAACQNLENQIKKLESVGLEEEKKKLQDLQVRLFEQYSLYKEWFKN